MTNKVGYGLPISAFIIIASSFGLFAQATSALSQDEMRKSETQEIIDVDFIGLQSTKREVVMDLLPRPLPDQITDDELREFKRRIKYLGLFDSVLVKREGTRLKVALSHKGTLSPIVQRQVIPIVSPV